MSQVKLSVVIPTYNGAALITDCLDALEAQTADKALFEVIVVDDGSADETPLKLKRYAKNTQLQLKILYAPHGGPGAARNRGITAATSPWIAFIDSDTFASPQWIATGLALLEQHPDAGGFEGCTEVCNPEGVTPFTHQTENNQGGRYPTCNLILRKSLCQFYPAYKIAFREDSDLAFSVLESGYDILFSKELLAFHPPLSPRYDRPLSLAKRYYYDSLLQKRFPERYKYDLDSHSIAGLKIPHLRRKIYMGYVGVQLLLFGSLFGGSVVASSALAILCVLSYLLVARVHLHHVQSTQLRFMELGIILALATIVPWVTTIQKLRGDIAFRNEPPFSPEKWLISVRKMELPQIPRKSLKPRHPSLIPQHERPMPLSARA